MARKKVTDEQENTGPGLLIWILMLLIILILCVVLFDIFFLKRKSEAETSQNSGLADNTMNVPMASVPAETDDLDSVTVTLKDYLAFDFDDLDFDFVIARIHVTSAQPINISLNHFKTDEGITLDDVSEYAEKLEDASYFLGRQSVWFSLISEDTSYDANIFIPVKNKDALTVKLSMDFGNNGDLIMNLVPASGTREMLQYQADDVISDGKTYQMSVSAAYDITGEYIYETVNGEESEYLLPSTTKVYAFKVNAVSLYGDELVIDQAQYIPSSTNEVFEALGSGIRTMKKKNILDRVIREKDSGYLFFYAFDPDDHPVTYTGILKLHVKSSGRWITVNVNLN